MPMPSVGPMPQRGEGPSHVAAGISLARATTAQGFPKVRSPPLGDVYRARLRARHDVTGRSALTAPRHHLPQCPGSEPCSPAFDGRAEADKREGCRFSCKPAPPWCVADYEFHSPVFEIDHSNPLINEPRVLSGADVVARPTPAWEQPVIFTLRTKTQPRCDRLARWLGDLEGHRSSCLLLDDD